MENIQKLKEILNLEYGIKADKITPAKRGFFGETWRTQAGEKVYFVKLDCWTQHKEKFRSSFGALDFLKNNGIDFAVGYVPTSSGKPCIDFEGGVLGVFPFANGENREDYPLGMLFERLCKIYSLDISNAKIESDDIRTCDAKKVKELVKLCGETCHAAEVQRIIDDNRALINHCEKRLAEFAPFCTVQNKPLHLTHGDAGGNCIVSDNSFYIIDWDQACLAPIERDAWFFMQRWQQIELINKCLEPIGEKLDSDLLCFYCYHTFFYYLCEYLTAVLTFPQIGEKYTKMLRCYFSSWILDPIKVADTIVPGVKVL